MCPSKLIYKYLVKFSCTYQSPRWAALPPLNAMKPCFRRVKKHQRSCACLCAVLDNPRRLQLTFPQMLPPLNSSQPHWYHIRGFWVSVHPLCLADCCLVVCLLFANPGVTLGDGDDCHRIQWGGGYYVLLCATRRYCRHSVVLLLLLLPSPIDERRVLFRHFRPPIPATHIFSLLPHSHIYARCGVRLLVLGYCEDLWQMQVKPGGQSARGWTNVGTNTSFDDKRPNTLHPTQ